MNRLYAIGVTIIFALTFWVSPVMSGAAGTKNKDYKSTNTAAIKTSSCYNISDGCLKLDAWGYATQAMSIYNEQVASYLNALEEQRKADEAAAQRDAQKSVSVVSNQSQSFDAPSECTGKVLPAYIIIRESHCNYGAVNVNGCGGYSCYGMYQIDGRHWSNWNGTPGACNDLDWNVPADQDECANRLSSGGTNLRPWGG